MAAQFTFRASGGVGAVFLGLVSSFCSPSVAGDTAAPVDQAVPVRVAAIRDTTIALPVTATGVLAAKEEVPLGFKIGGVISRMAVEEGDKVRVGQLLATLETPEIAGEVAKAQAAVVQADRDLVRATALYADSVIPRAAFEGAETAVAVARANLKIASFNQQYASIRAPAAGTVLRRLAEPGQQIAGGTTALLLGTSGRGQVLRAGLSDRDVERVALGDPASVAFDGAGAPVAGHITQIAAAATPGSGTWTVEIRLDRTVNGPAGGLASGLIGSAEIRPARREPVRLVPLGALLEGDADSGLVYSLAPGDSLAQRHRVRVAFLTADQVAIRDGLSDAASVVVEGSGYLHDGALVRVLPGAGLAEPVPGGVQ
jgi:membrane fusion protein, multidrug efflux system